VIIHLLLQQPQ